MEASNVGITLVGGTANEESGGSCCAWLELGTEEGAMAITDTLPELEMEALELSSTCRLRR